MMTDHPWHPSRIAHRSLPEQLGTLLAALLLSCGLIGYGWLAPLWAGCVTTGAEAERLLQELAARKNWQAQLSHPAMQRAASGLGCDPPGIRALAASLELGILLGKPEPGRQIGPWDEASAALMLTGRFTDLAAFAKRLQAMRPATQLDVRALVGDKDGNVELHGMIRCLQHTEETR
jgi:hypothetical protein